MTDRTLKDAMRRALDLTLSDLAYNVGFRLRDADMGTHTVSWHSTEHVGGIGVKHHHHERQDPVPNGFHGGDFGRRWLRTTGERAGSTAYIYEPPNRTGGRIIVYGVKVTDVLDVDYRPAETLPQGAPTVRIFREGNDAPRPKRVELEVEDETATEKENTIGWLVSTEFEIATRISGGVAVTAEASARLETRVEARGDSRFETRNTHREALRRPRTIGPYAELTGTLTTQLQKITQPVIVTGKLDASVYVEAHPEFAHSDFVSIDQLYDCMRGFGGVDGRVAEWWGKPGKAIAEDEMQRVFEPLRPVVHLELRPHDTLSVDTDHDVHEHAYPGRETEYEEYKPSAGADDGGGW